jgi:hypothetical protein
MDLAVHLEMRQQTPIFQVLSIFYQVRSRSLRTVDENCVLVHYIPLLVAGKMLCRAKDYGYLNLFTKERLCKSCRLYQPLYCYFRMVDEIYIYMSPQDRCRSKCEKLNTGILAGPPPPPEPMRDIFDTEFCILTGGVHN